MKPEIVAEPEAECIPRLKEYVQELPRRFPRFSANVGSGSLPATDGHLVFLDCSRQGSAAQEPNCVSLEVGVRNRADQAILCMLDVCWGGDGIARREALDCLEEAVPWGASALKNIRTALPALKADLEECLKSRQTTYLK